MQEGGHSSAGGGGHTPTHMPFSYSISSLVHLSVVSECLKICMQIIIYYEVFMKLT